MGSPFLVGIKRGILISLGLVIFWLLLDFVYLSKLESTNKSNLEYSLKSILSPSFISEIILFLISLYTLLHLFFT